VRITAFRPPDGSFGGGQQARHLVLEPQHLLGALLPGDVAPHAAVAGEAAIGLSSASPLTRM
jgi:hypothetical protein